MSEQSNSNKKITSKDYRSVEKDSSGKRASLIFPAEFDMILAYREKMKMLSERLDKQNIQNEPLNEPLGFHLDRDKIKIIMEQKGFHSLVAFFAVENPNDPLSKNTLVIMGADIKLNLLPYDLDHGHFTQISETWSFTVDKISNEGAFQEFFRIELI